MQNTKFECILPVCWCQIRDGTFFAILTPEFAHLTDFECTMHFVNIFYTVSIKPIWIPKIVNDPHFVKSTLQGTLKSCKQLYTCIRYLQTFLGQYLSIKPYMNFLGPMVAPGQRFHNRLLLKRCVLSPRAYMYLLSHTLAVNFYCYLDSGAARYSCNVSVF